MQLSYFDHGRKGYVAHKYRIDGIRSKFSVWFNQDGFAIDAQRIDSRGRAYPVKTDSPIWRDISRHKLAGHFNADEIQQSARR